MPRDRNVSLREGRFTTDAPRTCCRTRWVTICLRGDLLPRHHADSYLWLQCRDSGTVDARRPLSRDLAATRGPGGRPTNGTEAALGAT